MKPFLRVRISGGRIEITCDNEEISQVFSSVQPRRVKVLYEYYGSLDAEKAQDARRLLEKLLNLAERFTSTYIAIDESVTDALYISISRARLTLVLPPLAPTEDILDALTLIASPERTLSIKLRGLKREALLAVADFVQRCPHCESISVGAGSHEILSVLRVPSDVRNICVRVGALSLAYSRDSHSLCVTATKDSVNEVNRVIDELCSLPCVRFASVRGREIPLLELREFLSKCERQVALDLESDSEINLTVSTGTSELRVTCDRRASWIISELAEVINKGVSIVAEVKERARLLRISPRIEVVLNVERASIRRALDALLSGSSA